uniref:Uncharacterized protein n=1 Tax=Setaria viridis TaxID=4556 RepID=A0A4U6W863_SETVI|nr:hypothetical protein SEVIR_1G020050v2 [Setaria viridis]
MHRILCMFCRLIILLELITQIYLLPCQFCGLKLQCYCTCCTFLIRF